jgi:hypothetical protein
MSDAEEIITEPIFSEEMCLNILDYLQGWSTSKNSVDINGDTLQLNDNNVVGYDEVKRYWTRVLVLVQNYLCRDSVPDIPEIVYAVCKWTAGLLYKKYNVRANDNMEDDQVQVGYGDFLIHSAKDELSPYRFSKLSMW